jgi:DNA repair exonuclease SbcCD ATPase subunit
MVYFKSISFKNLLSFGNKITTINFDKGNTLITGDNGNGKSAILDALFFALFGKSMRKGNNASLINRRNNKDLYVECIFKVNGKEYLIKRGLKPKIFRIYINDKEMDSNASVHETQAYVEKIIGMNQDSFRQIVVLGITDFTPFMRLNPNQRRTVIEQILDIEIFGELNKLIKSDTSHIKSQLQNNTHKIDLVNNSLNVHRKHLQEIKYHIDNEDISDEIELLESQINEIGINNEFLHKELSISHNDIDLNEIKTIHQKSVLKKQHLNKSIINLKHLDAECPLCLNPIDEQYKESLINQNDKQISLLDNNIFQMNEIINNINIEHKRIKHINENIDKNNRSVTKLINEIKVLRAKTPVNDNTKAIIEEIDKLREEVITLENEKRIIINEKESLNILDTMLCDSGVKRHIIKKYLPFLNKQINQYIKVFDFPIVLKLDEVFNEEVWINGRGTDGYRGFSEGEKLRIDLSILFSLRDLAKEKNCVATNLLVFDEMDFSLDYTGLRSFLDIILGTDKNLSIMMISHKNEMKDEFREEFDNSIIVDKGKTGFSKINFL